MESKTLGLDNRVYVGQLFKAAFGAMPVYMTFPLGKKQEVDMSGYAPKITEQVSPEEAERLSIYGTPVVFPMKFLGGTFKKYDDKGRLLDTSLSDFWLPDATMADFSRAKNIIKTNTLGSNGTIKEVYGFDDWNIRIRTLCLRNREMDEREQEKKILEWFNIVGSIGVEGYLFTKKNIKSIVLEDIDIKSVSGSPNVIPIEITAVSDEAVELAITLNE